MGRRRKPLTGSVPGCITSVHTGGITPGILFSRLWCFFYTSLFCPLRCHFSVHLSELVAIVTYLKPSLELQSLLLFTFRFLLPRFPLQPSQIVFCWRGCESRCTSSFSLASSSSFSRSSSFFLRSHCNGLRKSFRQKRWGPQHTASFSSSLASCAFC